jgi:hypothetical protein
MNSKKILKTAGKRVGKTSVTVKKNIIRAVRFNMDIQKENLPAGELFNLFTADIIKENVVFTR